MRLTHLKASLPPQAKVKLPLYLIKYHAMKTYGGVDAAGSLNIGTV